MPSLPPHRHERESLCDLFVELGPDAPTLCEGWTTQDLAAHLYVREHDPIGAPGIVIPALHSVHERAIHRVERRLDYPEMVRRLKHGPPAPMRPLDSQINVHEWFVHHEDVRRGRGDFSPRPYDEIEDVEEAVWQNLQRSARLLTMRIKGLGFDLIAPDRPILRTGRAGPRVTIVGRPGEILLFLFGRGEAADVTISGIDEAQAILADATLGI